VQGEQKDGRIGEMLLENPCSLKNRRTEMNAKTRYLTTGMALLLMGLSLVTAVTLTAPQPARANPGVLYAAPTAQGSGNCSSWDNACTLQSALASAVSGDEIWVKAGVHYPGAAGNREATFTLKNGVALYGGFAGNETSRDQRDPQANPTILSGDIDQNDVNTDGNFIAETWNDIQGENAYHVVTGNWADNTAVLDGFIITAGQANGSYPHSYGGGMYNNWSNPTLSNVTFSGNLAASGAAACTTITAVHRYPTSPFLAIGQPLAEGCTTITTTQH